MSDHYYYFRLISEELDHPFSIKAGIFRMICHLCSVMMEERSQSIVGWTVLQVASFREGKLSAKTSLVDIPFKLLHGIEMNTYILRIGNTLEFCFSQNEIFRLADDLLPLFSEKFEYMKEQIRTGA